MFRKLFTLISLGLATATMPACWCENDKEYHFDGQIGEERVRFYERGFWGQDNFLEVTKSDGTKVLYIDEGTGDSLRVSKTPQLRLDSVEITKGGKTTMYNLSDKTDKPVVEEAQKKFDAYLDKIVQERRDRGLEDLK